MQLERVYLGKTDRQTDYATPEALTDLLITLKAKYGVPIHDAIGLLSKNKVDSISFSKNVPYFNFHATRMKDVVWISVREVESNIEFKVQLKALGLCIND